MTNVALDLVGQARLLLAHAGKVEGKGRDEDQLAFLRDVPEFRNATLAELPSSGVASAQAASGDYAIAILRNLLFSAYQCELWRALSESSDGELAAIAAKSLKESRYHLRHAADWTIRFGDGTDESHRRAQAALDALWPYTHELFEPDPVEAAVARHSIGVASATLRQGWRDVVAAVVAEATLRLPPDTAFRSAGKLGLHSEHLGYLLTEMQSLHRQHPGATW
jgi:ring-1,2-phenylacetyl-CoA epoxidase subunit PaaC